MFLKMVLNSLFDKGNVFRSFSMINTNIGIKMGDLHKNQMKDTHKRAPSTWLLPVDIAGD